MPNELTTDDLIDAAELGDEAKRFIETDLCKTLLARAEQEATMAMEELSRVDPEDRVSIRALQARVGVARKFPDWLNEIINIGENAKAAWRQQHGTQD